LLDFVERHGQCGKLTGDATQRTEPGYRLTVVYPCGVVFERWITPEDPTEDMVRTALLALPN
jgi:hypothetical protein